ncbi:MAG: hypothetical protein Q9166_004005 [cf. Caloplaca sp. 2 TL-2023]
MPFQYKHVLLIGATSGIGGAMADRLVEEGSKVIAVGRRQDRLDDFVRKHGQSKAGAVRFDLSDSNGTDGFVEKVTQEHPDLDCVFLNAGVQTTSDFTNPTTFDIAALRTEVAVNFTCVVELTAKFLPFLQNKGRETSFIYTGSNVAFIPAASIPIYSATKAALNSFILSLRLQLQGSSVNIIELSPPPVQTELHDYMGPNGRQLGMPLDAFTEQAYRALAAGKDQIIIGAIGPEAEFNEMVDKHRAAAEGFWKIIQSHSLKR